MQILQPRVLDLNALITGIEKLLRRTIPENVEIVLDVHPQLEDHVRADPAQLEQVLVNLAVNARDAMPNGGQIRIVTDVIDLDAAPALRRHPMTSGRYVRVFVSDTGTGMTAETQARIFEPFFTTKGRGKRDRPRTCDRVRELATCERGC